jgi:ribosome biogenesis GTPase
VIEAGQDTCIVLKKSDDGRLIECKAVVSGKFRNRASSPCDFPTVGDWVLLRKPMFTGTTHASDGVAHKGESSNTEVIEAIVPRRSGIIRKRPGDTAHDRVEGQILAANADVALIVTAAGRDFNLRRLERYLALTSDSGVTPIIVISKLDLAEDGAALVRDAQGIAPATKVIGVSAISGIGMHLVDDCIPPAKTAVFLGSSGAGKSTLLNKLAGSELQKTLSVKEYDERGKHTTTSRSLFRLGSGALIIDTPGLREIQLWIDPDSLGATFPEIAELAATCRFRDCRHESEPGCAVKEALASGVLDMDRFDSFQKLVRESAYVQSREDPLAKAAERALWKSRSKAVRKHMAMKRGED